MKRNFESNPTILRKGEVNRMQFFLFVIWTFLIGSVEGLKWTSKPPPINKCIGHNVTFLWTFEKEASEEVRQLQFIVNSTKLIAYKSVRNGFYEDPEYQGRVEMSSETGIVLKNISAKDAGNYTLYPIIAREESPNIQSIWLNVIETTIPQWCTCESLPFSTKWSSGQTFSIVAEGCHLEINSSFCCPKGPAIEYCESDPQKLCVPIRNPINITESTTQSRGPISLNESTTQSQVVPEQTDNKKDVKEENTQSQLLVVNTSMTVYLVIYSLVLLLWKIYSKSDQYKQRQKNHEKGTDSLLRSSSSSCTD